MNVASNYSVVGHCLNRLARLLHAAVVTTGPPVVVTMGLREGPGDGNDGAHSRRWAWRASSP
eukprot:11652717-Alexandrium_andersonii.AAC.1